MNEKLKKFFQEKVYYDEMGQMIFSTSGKSDQLIANVRGWGAIQNLFPETEEGQKQAGEFQDKLGFFIAEAINEKLNKINE